jgi:hypothetical protein
MIDRPYPVTRLRHAADEALDLARGRRLVPRPGRSRRQRSAGVFASLRLADDYSSTATVVSFTGLTDAQQHVLAWAPAVGCLLAAIATSRPRPVVRFLDSLLPRSLCS